jgi:hypothetical protein
MVDVASARTDERAFGDGAAEMVGLDLQTLRCPDDQPDDEPAWASEEPTFPDLLGR